ncbi:hypothetical protein AAZX31_14G110700 [Glycine max]
MSMSKNIFEICTPSQCCQFLKLPMHPEVKTDTKIHYPSSSVCMIQLSSADPPARKITISLLWMKHQERIMINVCSLL